MMDGSLVGRRVRVTPRQQPLDSLVQAYAASPAAFQRQFGRPLRELDAVLEVARSAQAHGFSSYFDVQLLEDGSVIGHLRVDWSLQEEGLICLHGGSPLDEPGSPGHRRRAHARARQDAWLLMLREALATPGIERVGTATAASNRAAQAFIAASGFRRTRRLQLPEGRETMVHYRIVREWYEAALGVHPTAWIEAAAGIDAWRPAPSMPAPSQDTVATAALDANTQLVQGPPGWTRIDTQAAPGWIEAASTEFLRGLADSPPRIATREDVVQTLFFEAAHGTQFFGHAHPGTSCAAPALIAVKPLPRRPGWWLLRGGPLAAQQRPPALRHWLDHCFEQSALRRVEAQVCAAQAGGLDWWRACGLAEEGITEIDSRGQPLAYTLARVAA